MGKILALLVVIAVLLGVGDVAARHYAERQLAQRVSAKVTAQHVHVAISSFPFLGRLAVSGTVPKIQVHADDVSSGPLTLSSVTVAVYGVKIDRTAPLHHRKVQVQHIDRGTVTADMTVTGVNAAVASVVPGTKVTLGDGVVQVTMLGAVSLSGRVAVVNGQLRFTALGVQVAIPIPALPLLPCTPNATVVPGHLLLSCAFDTVPTALLNQAG